MITTVEIGGKALTLDQSFRGMKWIEDNVGSLDSKEIGEVEKLMCLFHSVVVKHQPDMSFNDSALLMDQMPGTNVKEKTDYLSNLLEKVFDKDLKTEEKSSDPTSPSPGESSKSLDTDSVSGQEKSGSSDQTA